MKNLCFSGCSFFQKKIADIWNFQWIKYLGKDLSYWKKWCVLVDYCWDYGPSKLLLHFIEYCLDQLNPIQDGLFPPSKNLSYISYNDETWHSYTLPKEDPKNIWITWHTRWVLLISAFFHRRSANFAISRNSDVDCILMRNFHLF